MGCGEYYMLAAFGKFKTFQKLLRSELVGDDHIGDKKMALLLKIVKPFVNCGIAIDQAEQVKPPGQVKVIKYTPKDSWTCFRTVIFFQQFTRTQGLWKRWLFVCLTVRPTSSVDQKATG